MNRAVFKQARERLAAAAKKAESLRHAQSPEATQEFWSEYLVNHNRVFLRLGNAMETPQERGWFDRLSAARKADPLLKYLNAARDADEHGREEITQASPGGLAVGVGGTHYYIEHMVVRAGRLEVLKGWQDRPGNPIKVEYQPGDVRLQPVRNRGVDYPVPDSHLGEALTELSPMKAAAAGLLFLTKALDEASSKFCV